MAHPGRKPGDDYIDGPYLEGWEPVEDRKWAMKFISVAKDGTHTENYDGFLAAFRKKYPMLWQNQIPSFLPATVDDYVRLDANGARRDVDYELAAIPLDDEEIEDRKKARKARIKKRREAVLEKRRSPRARAGDEQAAQA